MNYSHFSEITNDYACSFTASTLLPGSQYVKEYLREAEENVPQEWKPGDLILGLYDVQHVTEGFGPQSKEKDFHQGGFGRVYKVFHLEWQQEMAVKSPRPEYFVTPEQKQIFTHECESWMNLGHHPNIAVCDYVRELGGIPRIFAEYAQAGTLEDWIKYKRLYADEQYESLNRILDIIIQFAWGLNAAHEAGLVHQDVKPMNLLMWNDCTAKVADFGLANAGQAVNIPEINTNDATPGTVYVTGVGMTPAYCSPEQAKGLKLSHRTDIWSWALSVLAVFTGGTIWARKRRPTGMEGLKYLDAYLSECSKIPKHSDKSIPLMPKDLASLLRKCLKEDPNARPNSMMECADIIVDIYEAIAGKPYPRLKAKRIKDTPDILNNRALSYLDLGDSEKAERCFEEALAKDLHHTAATYNYNLMLWRRASIDDLHVLSEMQTLSNDNPHDWQVFWGLGWINMERGDLESAKKHFNKAVILGGDKVAAKGLDTLKSFAEHMQTSLVKLSTGGQAIKEIAINYDHHTALIASNKREIDVLDLKSLSFIKQLEGHFFDATSVSITPDGQEALSSGMEKSLRFWNLQNGECIHLLEAIAKTASQVAISPDGRSFAFVSENGIAVWDWINRQSILHLKDSFSDITCIAYTHDSSKIIAGSRDKSIRLWELETGQCVKTFRGHNGEVNAINLSPDGLRFISAGNEGDCKVWDIEKEICLQTFTAHRAGVTAIAFSGNGLHAFSGDRSGIIKVWDTFFCRCIYSFYAHQNAISALVTLGSEQAFLSASVDGNLLYCNWTTAGHALPLYSTFIVAEKAFENENIYHHALNAAKAHYENSEYNLAYAALEKARSIPGYARTPEVISLARRLAPELQITGYKGAWLVQTINSHNKSISCTCFSRDGRSVMVAYSKLLTNSNSSSLSFWNLSSGHHIREITVIQKRIVSDNLSNKVSIKSIQPIEWIKRILSIFLIEPITFMLKPVTSILHYLAVKSQHLLNDLVLMIFGGLPIGVNAIALYPWPQAVIACPDHSIRVLDLQDGEEIHFMEGHKSNVVSVAIDPTTANIVSGSWDSTVKVWNPKSGICLATLNGHENMIYSVAVSYDGTTALSGSLDKTIKLWSLSNHTCLRTFTGHQGGITSVAYGKDGSFIVSASKDNTINIWDINSGKCRTRLTGHVGSVETLSVCPKGYFLVTGSEDQTLRIWDLQTGNCLRVIQGHKSAVKTVSFSHDGRFIISGSENGTLKIWECDWEYTS